MRANRPLTLPPLLPNRPPLPDSQKPSPNQFTHTAPPTTRIPTPPTAPLTSETPRTYSGRRFFQPDQNKEPSEALKAGTINFPVLEEHFGGEFSFIGGGANGKVYCRTDPDTGKKTAFKILLNDDEDISPEKFHENFKHEVAIQKHLSKSGICPKILSEHIISDKVCIMEMDYIGGSTLAQHLKKNANLSSFERKQLMIKLVQLLSKAHQQGVVLRDLKPENIVIDELGQPYLIDFGISRFEDEPNGEQVNATPFYCAPESIADTKNQGKPADLFSLGRMFCQIAGISKNNVSLNGEPLDTFTEWAVLLYALSKEYSFPSDNRRFNWLALRQLLKSDWQITPSARLLDLLTQMLEPDPDQRSTIEAVTESFQRIHTPEPPQASSREKLALQRKADPGIPSRHHTDLLSPAISRIIRDIHFCGIHRSNI